MSHQLRARPAWINCGRVGEYLTGVRVICGWVNDWVGYYLGGVIFEWSGVICGWGNIWVVWGNI